LVRFRAPAYPDSVSEPAFSEPDPVSVNKYRNGSRNVIFPSVSVRFHRYMLVQHLLCSLSNLMQQLSRWVHIGLASYSLFN
jgi:hypothetical protein